MILFDERPTFEVAWALTDFHVIMGGMGDDTAMMIAEMYERGYEPDEIVFCDTGSEFKHTYEFISRLQSWCAEKNWSKVVVLKKLDANGDPLSVIATVERDKTLPPPAFGKKSCSARFKTETGDLYFNNHPKAWKAWGAPGKGKRLDSHKGVILRAVGINADEPGRAAKWSPQHKWVQVFPLVDWDIGERESTAVGRVGLYYPGKSSCICCPNLTGGELAMLRDDYPEDFQRIVNIEKVYQENQMTPDSTTIGLFRSQTIAMKLEAYDRNPRMCTSLEQDKCQECS